MPNCNKCGQEIEWKKSKAGKNYPVNKDGEFHSTTCGKQAVPKEGAKESTQSVPTASSSTPTSGKTTREQLYYEGIVDIQECNADEAKELLHAGWVLLKISEEHGFANSRPGMGGGTEMLAVPMAVSHVVYVLGQRA